MPLPVTACRLQAAGPAAHAQPMPRPPHASSLMACCCAEPVITLPMLDVPHMRGSGPGQPQPSPLRGHLSQQQQFPGGFQLPKLPPNFPQMVPQGPSGSWDALRLPAQGRYASQGALGGKSSRAVRPGWCTQLALALSGEEHKKQRLGWARVTQNWLTYAAVVAPPGPLEACNRAGSAQCPCVAASLSKSAPVLHLSCVPLFPSHR